MKSNLNFLVLIFLLIQCKAKENLKTVTVENNLMDSEMYLSAQKDTIYGRINDTVIVALPVEFTKGRFWNQRDTIYQIHSFKQDETQKFEGQELKDFQRFYYNFKDTGSFALTYLLQSPIGKDTTVYAIQSKYLIIKK
jgi:hypothetical protein